MVCTMKMSIELSTHSHEVIALFCSLIIMILYQSASHVSLIDSCIYHDSFSLILFILFQFSPSLIFHSFIPSILLFFLTFFILPHS